ncbi:MAG: ATP synthase F1 subunit delta [Acholeplasmataceae bacterium]|jgi:F-type H+-transporting ATPase subunit delta|nr:ATP synthase F1 subunit delta [Acholeplasmataceae bacterium]
MRISNYAKALFSLSMEQKKLDQMTVSFADFMDESEKNPTWIHIMDSPMIGFDAKKEMIDALPFDVSFLSFLKMLAEKNRLHYADSIYQEWKELTRAYLKIAYLHIYSAKEISEETLDRLKKALQPVFPKHTISFHVTIDQTLIGGIKIVHQGQSLDRSISRELEELFTTI